MIKIKNYFGLIVCFFLICVTRIQGATFGIPEPKVMLSRSEVVGVATLKKDSGQWKIKFSRLLKGKRETDVWIPLSSPGPYMDMDFFGKMVGNDSFLFFGRKFSDKDSLVPAYWMVSAWPHGKPRDSRLETLEGSIKFAEAILTEQVPAGVNVMPENAVLPPILSDEQIKELRKEQDTQAISQRESGAGHKPAQVVTSADEPQIGKKAPDPVSNAGNENDSKAQVPKSRDSSILINLLVFLCAVVVVVICWKIRAKRK